LAALEKRSFDVLIVGGGVIGTSIARELSRYKLDTVLLEKSTDLAAGASRANTGLIHAGFDPKPGSLKAELNVRGNHIFENLAGELQVPFRRNGALVIAEQPDDFDKLEELKSRGNTNGVDNLQVLDSKGVEELAPAVTIKAAGALYAPTAGIISPYELTFALAENAHSNGVRIHCGTELIDIKYKNQEEDRFIVTTNAGIFKSRLIINAAGLFSDTISQLAGLDGFKIRPRRGEYLLMDKNCGVGLTQTVFPLPTGMSKGIVITPTVSGNLLLGPNAEDISDKSDTGTTVYGQNQVYESAVKLIPSISKKFIITSFSGLRAVSSTGDFIIGPTKVDGFINAAGIQSPGLTAAPAIAELIVEYVGKALGLKSLSPNESFNGVREKSPSFCECNHEERTELIRSNRNYSRVVCRCEHVTEAEVQTAVNITPGAHTLDGVKFRTRAGMGRCQGGFCSDKVMEILARELKIPFEKLTKHEEGSWILASRTKVRGRKNPPP
jgi:glycerol-3-phosphate dehydrogenase